jgi:hypothetical protein
MLNAYLIKESAKNQILHSDRTLILKAKPHYADALSRFYEEN